MCQSPLNTGACAAFAGVSAHAPEPSQTAHSAARVSLTRIASDLIDVIPGAVVGHLQKWLGGAPLRIELAGRVGVLELLPGSTLEIVGADLRHHRRAHVQLRLDISPGARGTQAGYDPG